MADDLTGEGLPWDLGAVCEKAVDVVRPPN
jgi:hypothetical protein